MRKLITHFRMTCAFCYYGVVLLSTEILGDSGKGHPAAVLLNNATLGSNSSTFSPIALSLVGNGTECKNPEHKMLTPSDYVDLLWTTLAEFPGNTN